MIINISNRGIAMNQLWNFGMAGEWCLVYREEFLMDNPEMADVVESAGPVFYRAYIPSLMLCVHKPMA